MLRECLPCSPQAGSRPPGTGWGHARRSQPSARYGTVNRHASLYGRSHANHAMLAVDGPVFIDKPLRVLVFVNREADVWIWATVAALVHRRALVIDRLVLLARLFGDAVLVHVFLWQGPPRQPGNATTAPYGRTYVSPSGIATVAGPSDMRATVQDHLDRQVNYEAPIDHKTRPQRHGRHSTSYCLGTGPGDES